MIQFEPMQPGHWPAVKVIYEEGIKTGNATFETSAPKWNTWNNGHLKECRIIAVVDNNLLGWAALSPVPGQCVYAAVAEISVYVSAAARGKGIGKQLLQGLVEQSEAANLWTLQAGIFPENGASIKIHEDCGFRLIGRRERIGKRDGVWRDTLLLERRSTKVGV